MDTFNKLGLEFGNGICYSGFRDGQFPGGASPSHDQILEDLKLLEGQWKHLRLYDCDTHGRRVLEVIRKEKLDFTVMMGAYIVAEVNNYGCPWGGGTYDEKTLEKNKIYNEKRIETLIDWANEYPDIIVGTSVGNEACVDWTDHYVPVDRVIQFASMVKRSTSQPVTFCENYVPWLNKLKPLAEVLDFISVHTYPVWEYKHIHEAIEYTKSNYYSVVEANTGKTVVITEAGWATNTNGRGMHSEHVSEENQMTYFHDFMDWTQSEKILAYYFEAFDENWKGSPDPMEPEKHWGLYKSDRSPKLVMSSINNINKKRSSNKYV